MKRSRVFADLIIGILTATSGVWVDVTVWHRIFVGLVVAFAAETVLYWIDERDSGADEDEIERIRKNRDAIIRNMK